jgi:tubulin--tyrosine ligase
LPNAFELFGVDLLVTHSESGSLDVSVLELNAEPAIHLTGERLSWILAELFDGIAQTCVVPFFGLAGAGKHDENRVIVGDMSHGLRCCLATEVRGAGGW